MPSARYCGRCLSTFEGNENSCPNQACGTSRPSEGWGTVLAAGDVLDRHYRIDKCLAVGGAGLTYLAREIGRDGEPTDPKLAIKVLYTARASGPFLRRLSTEAQILRELAHENIVELRGFVHRAGTEPYLVTRFEEGGSLALHVDRVGPLGGPVAAAVMRQILLALDVAHKRGVIHRDLKPDNVLLAARTERDVAPHIRIADFGIAKVQGGVGEKLTRAGAFVGTPEFAAPEQFDGKTPTPATDLFAAGGLLVFLLTGEAPFHLDQRADIEGSHAQVLAQLPIQLPPVYGADAAVQDALQRIVDGMTRLLPEDRYTHEQALTALAPLADDVDTFTFERPLEALLRAGADLDAPPPPPPSVDVAPGAEALAVPAPPSIDPAPMRPVAPVAEEWTLAFAREQPPAPLLTDSALLRTESPGDDSKESGPPTSPRSEPAPDTVLFLAGSPSPEDAPPRSPRSEPMSARPKPPPAGPVAPPSAAPPEPAPAPPAAPLPGPPPPPVVSKAPTPRPAPPRAPTLTPAPPSPRSSPPSRVTPPSEQAAPPFHTGLAAVPEPPAGGRGSAGLAGCFGLSLFGIGAVTGGGILVVALVLVVVAAFAGWFRAPADAVDQPDPMPVAEQPPTRFRDAPELPGVAAQRLQRVVDDAQADIGAQCGHGGRVTADLLVDRAGWVVYADVHPDQSSVDAACVARKLQKIRVRMGNPVEGRARITLHP